MNTKTYEFEDRKTAEIAFRDEVDKLDWYVKFDVGMPSATCSGCEKFIESTVQTMGELAQYRISNCGCVVQEEDE